VNRTRSIPALTAILMIVGALSLLAGCSKDGNEWQRLVCEATQVNDGEPLVSAYLTGQQSSLNCDGSDLVTRPIDIIPVEFQTRPYNDAVVLTEGGPYSTFQITSYDVIWHPLTAAADSLTAYNVYGAGATALIPFEDKASISVLVADRHLKDAAWFAAALDPCTGTVGTFSATCELRFHGHETGSDREIVVPAQVTVNFVGYLKTQ
jgi:hypothetical protein